MATVRHFYLGTREIQIELSPQLSSTLDESLDNLTVNEIANTTAQPYIPFQKFYIKDENYNTIQTFILSADNVEVATQNPLRYIHHLTLVQESEFLAKHEIRNTVFSTPLDTNIKVTSCGSTLILKKGDGDGNNYYYERANNDITTTFDLTKVVLQEIKITPTFSAQMPYNANFRYRGLMEVYTKFSKPNKWSALFQGNTSESGTSLPTIVFTIGNETRTFTPLDAEVINGNEIKIPSEILNWIKTQNATLTISLQNPATFFPINGWIYPNPWNEAYPENEQTNIPPWVSISYIIKYQTISQSVLETIDTLLKQQMKETDDYNSTNDSDHIKPLFKLPTTAHNNELYQLLANTNTPNFIFTQATMYDALAEIFKLFDAIFTLDNDGYLDIEYFNDHQPINKPEIAGKNTSLGEERFTNKLITYFQNTKINDKFPNSNSATATAYVRSKTLGVPGESDFVFVVPKPIDIITKAKLNVNLKFVNKYNIQFLIGIVNYDIDYFLSNPASEAMDITNLVIESNIWSTLPANSTLPINGNWSNVGKYNSFTYTRGSNYIDISGYYSTTYGIKNQILANVVRTALATQYGIGGTTLNNSIYMSDMTSYIIDYRDVKMSVEYIALVDGKLVNESVDAKYPGETLINQSNGSIDINKLGLNMVGLNLKLGQPTLNMTQVFSKWDDRVKKGQYFIDENGDRWVANTCTYTVIKPDLIQTTIEFVKNFNGLAKRIELNSEKRLSNISNELTVKCEETYGEYIYYSSTIFEPTEPEKIALTPYYTINQLMMCLGEPLPSSQNGTYNALGSGKVVNRTIANLNDISHDRKHLYRVSGYANATTTNGILILATNNDPDNPGATITIPVISAKSDALEYDEISTIFNFNIPSTPQGTIQGTKYLVYLVIDESDNILFGAISEIRDVATLFDPTSIPQYIYKNTYKMEYALITAWHKGKGIINLEETGLIKHIAIPMVVYGSGNSVCFEMSYDSPISAGTQLLENSPLWTGGWFSSAVLYADKDGTADQFTIDFVKMQDELTRYFPAMKKSNNAYLETYSFGQISKLAYYKKPNEIFALNYQLHFLPKSKNTDFLSNEFIKNNAFANGISSQAFYIVYTTTDSDHQYSILDTKGMDNNGDIEPSLNAIVSITPTNYGSGTNALNYEIKVATSISSTEWNKISTWAIVDRNNNIYFASNKSPKDNPLLQTGEFAIYFMSRHHRLD